MSFPREYVNNIDAMMAGLTSLKTKLDESPSYKGHMELRQQHTMDKKQVSDKHAYTALIWSAGIALGGLILFQVSEIMS